MRKNGSRVSWEPYRSDAVGEFALNEMRVTHDGCSAQRRGDWIKWIEPAPLVRREREEHEALRARALAELEAEALSDVEELPAAA